MAKRNARWTGFVLAALAWCVDVQADERVRYDLQSRTASRSSGRA